MYKTVEELQQISRAQFEAASQSAAAVSRGLQQMVQEASSFSKRSMEEGSVALNKLIGVKSLEGAIQVQSDYARTSYETYVAGARRFGELFATLTKDVYRPFEQMAEQSQPVIRQ